MITIKIYKSKSKGVTFQLVTAEQDGQYSLLHWTVVLRSLRKNFFNLLSNSDFFFKFLISGAGKFCQILGSEYSGNLSTVVSLEGGI